MTPCPTFCMRFTLRRDGHRCDDCGMLVSEAQNHHQPEIDYSRDRYYEDPAYKAWQNWANKFRALRSGPRHVDLSFVTENDCFAESKGPSVYALAQSYEGAPWHIWPADARDGIIAYRPFIPVFEEYLPFDKHKGQTVFAALGSNPSFPTFERMTLCTCGWFRPVAEPTCPHHVGEDDP